MLSPKARKATKKKLKAHLKAQAECAKSKRQKEQLQQTLTLVEEPHLRRPRCAYFGEMLQMDASQHRWFGEQITHLHAAPLTMQPKPLSGLTLTRRKPCTAITLSFIRF